MTQALGAGPVSCEGMCGHCCPDARIASRCVLGVRLVLGGFAVLDTSEPCEKVSRLQASRCGLACGVVTEQATAEGWRRPKPHEGAKRSFLLGYAVPVHRYSVVLSKNHRLTASWTGAYGSSSECDGAVPFRVSL